MRNRDLNPKRLSLIKRAMNIAMKRKITLVAALNVMMDEHQPGTQECQFGSMPDSYDPEKDESHPNKGWNPDRGFDS